MRLISSYPRSGCSWLRFVICNLYYPDVEHDFSTINYNIPNLDVASFSHIENPLYTRTHNLKESYIYIHRHIGDVLVSQYWYNKKYEPNFNMSLVDWLFHSNFGQVWREEMSFYYNNSHTEYTIRYTELNNVEKLKEVFNDKFSIEEIQMALHKSQFTHLQTVIEPKGFGDYPAGDEQIKFLRCGRSNQWQVLQEDLQLLIISRNFRELKMYNYI